jgi:hypothetical protein
MRFERVRKSWRDLENLRETWRGLGETQRDSDEADKSGEADKTDKLEEG